MRHKAPQGDVNGYNRIHQQKQKGHLDDNKKHRAKQ